MTPQKILPLKSITQKSFFTQKAQTPTPNTIIPKHQVVTTCNPAGSKGATLNFLIREYNNLCKIDSFLKIRKGVGYVKGKSFIQ